MTVQTPPPVKRRPHGVVSQDDCAAETRGDDATDQWMPISVAALFVSAIMLRIPIDASFKEYVLRTILWAVVVAIGAVAWSLVRHQDSHLSRIGPRAYSVYSVGYPLALIGYAVYFFFQA